MLIKRTLGHRIANCMLSRTFSEAVQFATILGLVSSNAGVAIVPKSLTAIQLPNVSFLEIDHKDAFSRIYLARRMQEKSSPAAKKMVEITTNFASGLSGLVEP